MCIVCIFFPEWKWIILLFGGTKLAGWFLYGCTRRKVTSCYRDLIRCEGSAKLRELFSTDLPSVVTF